MRRPLPDPPEDDSVGMKQDTMSNAFPKKSVIHYLIASRNAIHLPLMHSLNLNNSVLIQPEDWLSASLLRPLPDPPEDDSVGMKQDTMSNAFPKKSVIHYLIASRNAV
jgi:hypothetical protein